MLLRAGLIHLGLPVYLAFRERRSSAQTPPAAPQWRTPAPLTPVPAVSIIIPVYKVERYLDTCVQSVLDQTFQDIEVLLVDDGSPDRCPEMCDAWAKSDRRVRVIHRKNGGLSLRATPASRPPVGGTSSLWTATTFWSRTPSAALWPSRSAPARSWSSSTSSTPMTAANGGPRRTSRSFRMKYSTRTACGRYFALETKNLLYRRLEQAVHRQAFADGLRFPEGKRYEDQFMLPHILHRCQNIACLGYQGYRYVQRADSIMAQGPASHYLDRPEYLLEWCGYFTEKGDYLRAEGLLNDAIKNLAEKDGFDLTTAQQRTRYRQACHDCSTAYGNLSRRTGRESMLRAGLLRLGLPLYRIFLKHKT